MARKPTAKRHTDQTGAVRVASKAANGSGSVYFDTDKGRWRATYTDAAGKRRTVTAGTRAEVEQRRDARIAELAAKSTTGMLGRNPTVAEVAGFWLEVVLPRSVRPLSLKTYRTQTAHVVDALGDVPVRDITREHVYELIAAAEAKGLSPVTVGHVRARLRQVIEQAITDGYVTSNVVDRVPAPKAKGTRSRRTLTVDEFGALLDSTADHRLGALFALLFVQGVRVSEALGLSWSDLDLDAGTARIVRASTDSPAGGMALGPPKTEATRGVIHLAPRTAELLRARRKAQAAERLRAGPAWESVTYEGEPIEPVFTNLRGGLMLRQHVDKGLRDALGAVGLPELGTHAGRRSAITALAVDGVAVDDIARLVGHASPTTTRGYVADLRQRPRQVAEHAHRVLDPGYNTAGD